MLQTQMGRQGVGAWEGVGVIWAAAANCCGAVTMLMVHGHTTLLSLRRGGNAQSPAASLHAPFSRFPWQHMFKYCRSSQGGRNSLHKQRTPPSTQHSPEHAQLGNLLHSHRALPASDCADLIPGPGVHHPLQQKSRGGGWGACKALLEPAQLCTCPLCVGSRARPAHVGCVLAAATARFLTCELVRASSSSIQILTKTDSMTSAVLM